MEAFTDAATAIIACVMILDIVILQFRTMGELKSSEELTKALIHLASEFVTFIISYIAVSLLWYVNHTTIHLFHTINTVLLYLQKLFLGVLSLLPLCGNIIHDFMWKGTNAKDSKLAARYAATVMFVAGGCNVLMVVWAYYKGDKVLHSWVLQGSKKHSHRQKLYVELKIVNIPFWAVVGFLGSFGSKSAAGIIGWISFVGMCVTFIILKLAFVNHIGKAERTKELRLTVKFNKKIRKQENGRLKMVSEATDITHSPNNNQRNISSGVMNNATEDDARRTENTEIKEEVFINSKTFENSEEIEDRARSTEEKENDGILTERTVEGKTALSTLHKEEISIAFISGEEEENDISPVDGKRSVKKVHSNSIVARCGGDEVYGEEMLMEKLQSIEFDGNEGLYDTDSDIDDDIQSHGEEEAGHENIDDEKGVVNNGCEE